jgi:hypothetical protein
MTIFLGLFYYPTYGEPNDANSSQGEPNQKSKESEAKNEKLNQLLKKTTTPDTNNLVPFIGDETPLSLVEAYPERYVGKSFYLIGGVNVSNTYFSKYDSAKNTHVSFWFREIRPDKTTTGKDITLYLQKHLSQSLVDAIIKTVQSGYSGKIVRVEVSILSHRFDPGHVMTAELLNWQTLTDDKQHWTEWQIISEPVSSENVIESDKIVYQGIERSEKWFNSMYKRFGDKIIYVNENFINVSEQIMKPKMLDSNTVDIPVGTISQFKNPCKVISLLGKGDIIASTDLPSYSRVHLQGIENVKEGMLIPRGFKFIYIGQFNHDNQTIPDFSLLRPLTKEQFKKALKSGIDLSGS